MQVAMFKRVKEDATLPVRGDEGSAGYDVTSNVDDVVPAKGRKCIGTGLSARCPDGTYIRVAPRSGLAVKKFIDVGAGVIDQTYTGEIGVVLFNFSDDDFEVKKGDRIAQLIFEKIMTPEVVEVDELPSTERGSGGFGSTGTR